MNQILADLLNEKPSDVNPNYDFTEYIVLAVLEQILIYNDHHYSSLDIGIRPDDHDLLWEMMLMQDLNGTNHASFVRVGMIKQAIFLDFLSQTLKDNYAAYEKILTEKLSINSLIDVALLFIYLQKDQDDRNHTVDPLIGIPTDHPYYQLFHLLNLIADTTDQTQKHTTASVMMHPFLKLSDQSLCFTGTHDFALLSDKAWAYFLFKEGSLTQFLPNLKRQEDFWSFLGLNYVEKFLMQKIFGSLNRMGLRVIPSDDLQTADITLIINETDIFLIEIKSVSIHFEVWQDQNLAEFKKHLNEQYIGEKKGVIQLHKVLQHLADEPKKLYQLHTPLHKLKIFPIIIYTEPHMSTVAVNDYIIKNSPVINEKLVVQFKSIAPVTLINYEFFMENIAVLRADKSLLKDAIIHYHQGIKKRKTHWLKINSTSNFSKAMETFDNYSAEYKGLYLENQNKIAQEMKAIFKVRENT